MADLLWPCLIRSATSLKFNHFAEIKIAFRNPQSNTREWGQSQSGTAFLVAR